MLDKRLLIILSFSLVLRIGAGIALGGSLQHSPGAADQLSYHSLAANLLEGSGFSFEEYWWPATAAGEPTAHWSFLYTYYLAGTYALFGLLPLAARLIQSMAVGILHPFLAYWLARRIFGESAGLAAAGVTAIYAYFVYYSATLMTEPFYITAILASLYLAIRLVDRTKAQSASSFELSRRAVALGVVLGAAVLLRQVFLLFIPILLLWVWWVSGRRRFSQILLPGLVVAVMILPFTLYNYARFGRFVLLNTNAGFAFFWANHPIYGTQFEPILPVEMGNYKDLIPEELRNLDEAALDQELLVRGLGFVARDPVRYLSLSLSRIPVYFKFWPSAESSALSNLGRSLSFGVFLPFMLYGLARAWIDRGKAGLGEPVMLLYLFIGIYSAIHLLSWALIRYRLPVDAALVIFAAVGLLDVAERTGVVSKSVAQPA